MKMKSSSDSSSSIRAGGVISSNPRRRFIAVVFFCTAAALSIGSTLIAVNFKEEITTWISSDYLKLQYFNSTKKSTSMNSTDDSTSSSFQSECRPLETDDSLPKGIISGTSDLERKALSGPIRGIIEGNAKSSKRLLAIAAGIKQKEVVDQMVKKFLLSNFTVILFHYDGMSSEWSELEWSDSVIHISAKEQTKWWFAKRFLHPDIVVDYEYIFLWDEDIGVENFYPPRYLEIVEREGLEISQPALDTGKSKEIHYKFTQRHNGDVHRRVYNFTHGVECTENSTRFPCTGFVEMMVPVFSRAAWRCVWRMIQNDLVHGWGLDMKYGYCAQGDPTKKVGVVDREYIVHQGIPTLGGPVSEKDSNATSDQNKRDAVVRRCFDELGDFNRRWQRATEEDKCWVEP